MAIELRVPEVGESITEVEIGEWLKSEGDRVSRDEAVVMIETDKVTVELPAPTNGVVTKILVQKGSTAAVGDVIGYMEEASGARAAGPASTREPAQPKEQPAKPPPPQESEDVETTLQSVSAVSLVDVAGSPADRRAAPNDGDGRGGDRVMPAARRALHDAGLAAEDVKATGPGGRLLKEDVQRAERARPPEIAHPPPQADAYRQEEVVPMTPLRRRIADRLVESQQNAALLTTFNEADMSHVMGLRKQYQEAFTEKYGIKLGFMSFFVKATIDALKLVPQVNAEIRGTDIVYRNYYDIGVAVGGGRGLVVPVIRNAERMSFAEVELTIADFAERARKNALKLDDLSGGTFTISNGGIYGSLMSTPIINPPQSGILGLHAIQDRPVVRDGQIVIRPMMYLALTYDHRLVDGREAVTFLKRIKDAIEAPARMFLEV